MIHTIIEIIIIINNNNSNIYIYGNIDNDYNNHFINIPYIKYNNL